MFAGCLQIMWAHSHLIRAEGVGYSQIIRAENADVCRPYGLCLQAATLSELLAKGMALTPYESPENAELRLALRTLEAQIIALTTEQIETEQLIEQFSKRQNSIIGDILGQYLHLRELVYAKRAQKSGKT